MKPSLAILAASAGILLVSCSSSLYRSVYPTLMDGRYDSEFPYRGCSAQLEEISETVKRVSILCNYKSYVFSRDDSITRSDITPSLLDRFSATYQHRGSAGTALVICSDRAHFALITCSHVVDYDDTTVTRFVGPDFRLTPYVRSIAIKMNQLIYLNDLGGGIALDILAIDRELDLAILGPRLGPEQSRLPLSVFQYPLGKARELDWGSFVYIFGYPAGYRMVTKGIVSLPPKIQKGAFAVDAVVAPGSSGSIALAIRDGVPNFELVGIIKMIPSQTSYLLSPSTQGDIEYDPIEPYHGDVFVQRKAEIQQGIVVAIPTESIISFLKRNQEDLARKGYDLSSWINPPKKEQQTH